MNPFFHRDRVACAPAHSGTLKSGRPVEDRTPDCCFGDSRDATSLPTSGTGSGSRTRASSLENWHAAVTSCPCADGVPLPEVLRLVLLSSLIVKRPIRVTLSPVPGDSRWRRMKPKKKPAPGFPDAGCGFQLKVYIFRTPTPGLVLSCGSCERYPVVFPCRQDRVKPITSEDFARVALVRWWACRIIKYSSSYSMYPRLALYPL